MGKHRAFGPARGAGSVDDKGQVRFRPLGESVRAGRWPHHAGELFDVKTIQRRKFCGQLGLGVRRAGFGDERICAGIGQNVADFIRLQEIVQGHDHAASPQDAENGGDEFGRVLQP